MAVDFERSRSRSLSFRRAMPTKGVCVCLSVCHDCIKTASLIVEFFHYIIATTF